MARTTRKIAVPATPILPASHLVALDEAGFTIAAYLDKAIDVQPDPDGRPRREWLPRLAIATGSVTGHKIIEWLPAGHPANNYGFDGWQAKDGHDTGGMYETPLQALAWFAWMVEARAGNPFGKRSA